MKKFPAYKFLIEERKIGQRKSLGQVKLVKKSFLEKISEFALPDDVVIEIGGGEGNLTELISKRAKLVISFEIDGRFVDMILNRINFGVVINKDFLEFPLEEIKNLDVENQRCKGDIREIKDILSSTQKFKIVSNIPFNISSLLIHKFISVDFPYLKSVHILVQKEFAQKISAKPGDKIYSAISAITNFFFDVNIEFDIPRFYFRPVPEVHASFISLLPKSVEIEKTTDFVDFVYKIFRHRRKRINGKRVYQLSPRELFEIFISDFSVKSALKLK